MYFSLYFRVCFLLVETILAIITLPQAWERSNVMIVSMCQSCLHSCLQNHMNDLHQIFVHVASDRGTVLYCNTLCTFGFVDDGTSSSSSRKGTISVAEQYCIVRFPIMDRVTHFNIGAESDVYDCLVVYCTVHYKC